MQKEFFLDTLTQLFERDLKQLKQEIRAYVNEYDLWKTRGEITNSAGNLCLHIIGNLNHYIGATLGNSGYERNRPAEFSQKNVPSQQLLKKIDETVAVIKDTLPKLTDDDLHSEYPLEMSGRNMRVGYCLVHLSTHLNYHLGQINYHRRLLSDQF